MANPIYQGPIGPKGEKGDQGETGAQGPKGDTGAQGPVGPQGPRGEQGPKGADGAFESLTPEQKEELRGPEGKQGPAGPEGKQGIQGPQGIQGIQGEKGPQGDVGPIGPKGPAGEKGDKGDPGEKGEAGPAGDSGVYVGSETPTNDANIWIDPNGTPIDVGGGGECRSIILPCYSNKLTDEHKAFLEEMWQYYMTNNAITPADIYIEMDMFYEKAVPSCISIDTSNKKIRMYVDTQNYIGEVSYYSFIDGVYSGNVGTNINWKDSSGGEWSTTSDAWEYDLYNAKEIYIQLQNTSTNNIYGFSYLVVPNGTTLGNYCYHETAITTTDGMDDTVPYWYYTGSGISIGNDNGYYVDYVAYKQ